MANPQTENGHTDIANDIMDALARTRIPGEARQVLDLIFRKTYGWHKKEDIISLSQFSAGTGLSKIHICRAIKTLLKMNLITQKGNKTSQTYTIIKDFEVWKVLPKKVTLPLKVIDITHKGNNLLPNKVKALPNRVITKESSTGSGSTLTSISSKEKVLKSLKLGRTQKLTDPRIKKIIDSYHDKYVVAFDHKPIINGGIIGKMIKTMLSTASEEEIISTIDDYLKSNDKMITESGYSFEWFYKRFNALRIEKSTGLTGTAGAFARQAKEYEAEGK